MKISHNPSIFSASAVSGPSVFSFSDFNSFSIALISNCAEDLFSLSFSISLFLVSICILLVDIFSAISLTLSFFKEISCSVLDISAPKL